MRKHHFLPFLFCCKLTVTPFIYHKPFRRFRNDLIKTYILYCHIYTLPTVHTARYERALLQKQHLNIYYPFPPINSVLPTKFSTGSELVRKNDFYFLLHIDKTNYTQPFAIHDEVNPYRASTNHIKHRLWLLNTV